MTPDEYCENKAAASGSSFYSSFRFLPPEQRRAITALYAFCREVDDVVDETRDPALARRTLDWWRAEHAALYAGQATHPVLCALAPHVTAFDLPHNLLAEIIDGMEMDLDQSFYPTFKDLQLYCYRVAGVVGQLSALIFGFDDKRTFHYAHDLGIAFQLTNIIRDVGEDARRGRVYLPQEDLVRFGVPLGDVLAYRESPAFEALMRFQIDRAQHFYDQALRTLPAVDARRQRVGLVMAAIYRALLDEIALDGPARTLNQKLSLPARRKVWLAWKTWTFGLKPRA